MFENFISLGWFCGTAASMSKYGLRSWSGPFDWYFSNFPGVLACMENNFTDFLDRKNLVVLDGLPEEFLDTKHGFHYNHEVITCLEEDYVSIYEKYARRIGKFREMIKQKTCFIRAVRNDEELRYIQNNLCVIEKIIKQSNPDNEIIYVVSSKEVTCGALEFPFFVVDVTYDGSSWKRLRGLYDTNIELQQFCIRNFDENRRYRHMYFDLQKENRRLESKAAKYELMKHIDKMNPLQVTLSQEIIIYGAEIVGKYLYQKIKCKCRVCCFVDQNVKEDSYDGVQIISLDDFMKRERRDIPIIVTDQDYHKVWSMLTQIGKSNVMSIDDFFMKVEGIHTRGDINDTFLQ